jgi:hypothetical protein
MLNVVACVLGSTQPLPPMLVGFVSGCEDKPRPCWYGIVPGMTTAQEVKPIIATTDYRIFVNESSLQTYSSPTTCDMTILYSESQVVYEVRLDNCKEADFGSVIDVLGSPEDITLGRAFGTALAFSGNTIQVSPRPYFDWTSFHTSFVISLSASPSPVLHAWHGYIARWRYCQYEPEFFYC